MPTMTYSNDPNAQGKEGTIYAPDLPWWVNKAQPAQYGGFSAPGVAGRTGFGGDRSAPAGETAGAVNIGVSAATPTQPTVGGVGGFNIDDLIGGFVPPVYGGGTGAQKTTQDLGFKFAPSGGRAKAPTGSITTSVSKREFVGERPELELPERDPSRVAA